MVRLNNRASRAWVWFKKACKKALWEDRLTLSKFLVATLVTAGFSLLILSLQTSYWGVSRGDAYKIQVLPVIVLNFFVNWKFTWRGQVHLGRSLWRWTVVQLSVIPVGYQLFQVFVSLDFELRLAKIAAGALLFVPAYLIAYFWAFADRWRNARNGRKTIVT